MLFNSLEFLLAFLPATFLVYFFLNGRKWPTAGKLWLVSASVFFYAWWNVYYVLLLAASITANYLLGHRISRLADAPVGERGVSGKYWLASGIAFNLALLGYYKYYNFFSENLATLVGLEHEFAAIALPLGISFFTFTQIAYLVDCHREGTQEYSPLNYALFVTFFPHLIAGPILHHKEMMPQFAARRNWPRNYANILPGLYLFGIGLFKKVVIADTFARCASLGFDQSPSLNFAEAWITSLSYTFQLYFDFSGYTDMAIGAALLFNIRLPVNFNSPYKALDIQDFWRRWHITLSRFLREYLYIPLGGNRRGITAVNLMATFLLGGLWHGASWMFVIWGGMHGCGMLAHRVWAKYGFALPKTAAWLLTFNFVNLSWVFFRAEDLDRAMIVLKGMFGAGASGQRFELPQLLPEWAPALTGVNGLAFEASLIALAMLGCLLLPNGNQAVLFQRARILATPRRALGYASLSLAALYAAMASSYSQFIYFNF